MGWWACASGLGLIRTYTRPGGGPIFHISFQHTSPWVFISRIHKSIGSSAGFSTCSDCHLNFKKPRIDVALDHEARSRIKLPDEKAGAVRLSYFELGMKSRHSPRGCPDNRKQAESVFKKLPKGSYLPPILNFQGSMGLSCLSPLKIIELSSWSISRVLG